MKTLLINGSPRKNGHTMALINELKQHLNGEMFQVNAYEAQVAPCTDCRYCWKHQGCSISDEMDHVYALLETCENFVIASPLYFSELTGPLLGLLSRLQRYYGAKYIQRDPSVSLERKKCALLITGGGSTKTYGKVMDTANIIFKHVNGHLVGTAISGNTDRLAAELDQEALNQVRGIAVKLNES